MRIITHRLSDEAPRPAFLYPAPCPVCGGEVHCLKGKRADEPLRRREDCPLGDVHPRRV